MSLPETLKIDLLSLAGDKPEPRPFVLPGLRARQIGILSSAGGVGKSFLALRACIETAAGLPILGGIWGDAYPLGKPVLYLSLEDDVEDLKIRVIDILDQLGIRNSTTLHLLNHNLVICNAQYLALRPDITNGIILPTEFNGLKRSPDLIVIDTLSRFLKGEDENSSGQMTTVFKEIEAHLTEYNAAGLILHHISKAGMGAQSRNEDTAGSERGSSVITFNARAAWGLASPSKATAEKYGIPEASRWQYSLLHQTKINGGRPHSTQWFQKSTEGVPLPIPEPLVPLSLKTFKPKCRSTTSFGGGTPNQVKRSDGRISV